MIDLFGRRLRLASAFLAVLAVLAAGASARAQEVRLVLGHGGPAQGFVQSLFLKPWAQRLPILSDGRLSVALEAGGEESASLLARVQEGALDIAWLPAADVLAEHDPLGVFELPFLAWPAEAVSQAALAFERSGGPRVLPGELRLLFAHADAPAALHLRAAPVRRLEELRGRRIFAPTRPLRALLRAAGATPLGAMPAEQVAEGLRRGALDGAVLSFASAEASGVTAAAPFHTLLGRPPGRGTTREPGLGTVLYILVMNAQRFAALPPDLQRVLAESLGPALAEQAGRTWDSLDAGARRAATGAGHVFHSPTGDELARWRRQAQPVIDAWLARAEGAEAKASSLLERARAAIARYYVLMDEEIEARTKPARGRGG